MNNKHLCQAYGPKTSGKQTPSSPDIRQQKQFAMGSSSQKAVPKIFNQHRTGKPA